MKILAHAQVAAPPSTARPRTSSIDRRNECEMHIRALLTGEPDVYVLRSRIAREKQDGDVIVTVVARNEAAKARAKERLAGCAGFAHREWAERWVPLNLGDALIRLYPERAAR